MGSRSKGLTDENECLQLTGSERENTDSSRGDVATEAGRSAKSMEVGRCLWQTRQKGHENGSKTMVRIIRAAEGNKTIPEGFPILVDQEMRIVEPAFEYLLEIALIRGRTASPRTVQTYAEQLLDWFDSLEQNDIHWRHATNETLGRYCRRHQEAPSPITGRKYAASTINARVRAVCRFYMWGSKTGWIERTPFPTEAYRNPYAGSGFLAHTRKHGKMSERSAMTISAPAPGRRGLSGREIRRLMQKLTEPYRTMVQWAFATGIRRLEVCALTTSQIPNGMLLREREGGLVEIRLTVTKGNRPRSIHAPLGLIDTTQRYIEGPRAEAVKARNGKSPEQLFLGPDGTPIKLDQASRKFRAAAVRANVEANFHCLRHSFAVNAYHALTKAAREHPEKNINVMMALRDLLGHSSVAATETYLRSLTIRPETIEPVLEYLYGAAIGPETDDQDGTQQ